MRHLTSFTRLLPLSLLLLLLLSCALLTDAQQSSDSSPLAGKVDELALPSISRDPSRSAVESSPVSALEPQRSSKSTPLQQRARLQWAQRVDVGQTHVWKRERDRQEGLR